jgi:hypothetical protein
MTHSSTSTESPDRLTVAQCTKVNHPVGSTKALRPGHQPTTPVACSERGKYRECPAQGLEVGDGLPATLLGDRQTLADKGRATGGPLRQQQPGSTSTIPTAFRTLQTTLQD